MTSSIVILKTPVLGTRSAARGAPLLEGVSLSVSALRASAFSASPGTADTVPLTTTDSNAVVVSQASGP